MATSSFTALRRLAGFAIALMLFSLCLSEVAAGQGTVPLVTATSAVGLSHPTGFGQIYQTAIDSFGDWWVIDTGNAALYEFPAGGGAAILVGGIGGLSGNQNLGIAIDPNNNIYLEGDWNNALLMFPYNAAAGNWTGLTDGASTDLSAANPTTDICTNSGTGNEPNCWAQYSIPDLTGSGIIGNYGYFQPWGIAIGNNGNLIVANHGGNNGEDIQSLQVTGAWSNPTVAGWNWVPLLGMTQWADSVAQDPESNVYLVEDYTQSSYLPGVLEIPGTATNGQYQETGSGSTAVYGDATLARVDPNLPSVTGVITDAAGNLYVSDSQQGVYMIPNSAGTPQTSSAVLLTSVPARGEVALDMVHNVMYVPTTQTQTNGQADVAKIGFGYAELGSSAVGTTGSVGTNVVFGFNGSATPQNFKIVEDGVSTPDFSITGGTCTTGTAYNAGSGCLQTISFTPASVGSLSAKLVMLDKSNNILASMVLHGTGMGSNIQVSPAADSTIGASNSLVNPSQVAVDASGHVYVADAGLGKVLMYPAGYSNPISIGTGLSSPTGVAVDGTGDVFIADSSLGEVFEIPYTPPEATALDCVVTTNCLHAQGQTTLVTGLGAGLNLAVDGVNNLYVADPYNHRVVKISNVSAFTTSNLGQSETFLTAGLTSPSYVAVDASGNLYVADGNNLFELTGGTGAPATLLSNLSGATGLAVDPSGAIYIAESGGVSRIPFTSGALAPNNVATITPSTLTNPMSVALDRKGNAYVADGTGLNVNVVSFDGAVPLPQPASLTGSTTATATIVNAGNSNLSVTGYTSSNADDFTAADVTCESSAVAAGGTCQALITFDPGPGQQGPLSGEIGVTSNAVNSPILIDATGDGLALSNSTTALSVASSAQVINTPVTVTVTAASGTGTPTGQVTLSYPSWTVSQVAGAGVINPVTDTVTATLNASGQYTFDLAPVLAGTGNFTISYQGDRVFGTSTQTITGNVAKSAITGLALPVFPDPSDIDLPFVIASTGNGTTPYDGSAQPYQYLFQVNVNTAAGVPTGTLTIMDNVTSCPPGTSTTGLGAADCILAGYTAPGGYSGVACPDEAGAGVLNISPTAATSAGAGFPTSCLWFVPQDVTYSPVMFTHYLSPVYSGDANFLGLTGSTSTLFQSVRGPIVQITQTSNSASQTVAPTITLQAGTAASMNLTLTSMLGWGISGLNAQLNATNLPVSLACDNLPPRTQCSFYYPTPDANVPTATDINCPSGATTTELANGSVSCTPAQVTVTFYTNVSAGTTTSQNARDTSVTLAAIFGFGMIGLFFRRRDFQKSRMFLMVFLMVVAGGLAMSITACNTTTLTSGATLATPSGNYQVTITANEVGTLCSSSPGGAGDNCIVPGSGSTTDNGILVYGSGNQVSLPFYVNVQVQ